MLDEPALRTLGLRFAERDAKDLDAYPVANVDDLPGFFATVEMILAPDGTFVLETGYWGGIVDNLLFDTIYHEHLSYFSLLPMQRFLATTALHVVDVQLTPSKGGCIRYHLGFRAAVSEDEDQESNRIEGRDRYNCAIARCSNGYKKATDDGPAHEAI